MTTEGHASARRPSVSSPRPESIPESRSRSVSPDDVLSIRAPEDDPRLTECDEEASTREQERPKENRPSFSLSGAFDAVWAILPEEDCPKPPEPPTQSSGGLTEENFWNLGIEKPSVKPTRSLPISKVVSECVGSLNVANVSSADKSWVAPAKVLKSLIKQGSYRHPSADIKTGLDLGSAASLDADANRAGIPNPSPATPASSVHFGTLERWEARERQILGAASQMDFFTAALVKSLGAIPDIKEDINLMHILLFLARTTRYMAASSSANMAEMLRARRASILNQTSGLIKENSRQRLLSAPLTSPLLFGGMLNEVLATEKDDQLLAKVASSSFKMPPSNKRPAPSSASSAPPPKKSVLERADHSKMKGPSNSYGNQKKAKQNKRRPGQSSSSGTDRKPPGGGRGRGQP